MPLTHSPDPVHLAAGAGTAAAQSAVPRGYAAGSGIGWQATAPVAATGAAPGAQGQPGTYTPAGAKYPTNAAAMTGIVATPVTAWPVDAYVPTQTGSAHWTGTAWAEGWAP
jgi:hypothetical protein